MTSKIPNRRGEASQKLWLVLAALAVLIFLVLWRQGQEGADTGPGVGQTLTRLELEPLTGAATEKTAADLQGKVTLLNFWGTWCPPCIQEFPHLAALAQQYEDREDFQLLAVSCGAPGEVETLDELRQATRQFVEAAKTSLPTYADPDQITRNEVDRLVNLKGYPTTLLIDRRGVIRHVWEGYLPGTEREMAMAVANLLVEGA